MELLIVTGMSGAGKSTVADALEDIGYYCVDNVPPRIISSFVELSLHGNVRLEKIAIVTDIRGGEMFDDIISVLNSLKSGAVKLRILFLDTADNELIRRYRENRRSHPLALNDCITVAEAVKKERNMLSNIRSRADYVIDTTFMSVLRLKQRIFGLFTDSGKSTMKIHCMSFGFKYGPVNEADLVFDVRCLPNPFYISELRPLSGMDKEIKDYVLSTEDAVNFKRKITEFIDCAVPLYEKEGKSSLLIAFGCTGGQHRSVTFAELMYAHLLEQRFDVSVSHRDMSENK